MRVFVTGASGFLGRGIADRYRAAGAEVRGVDLVADPAFGVVAGDVAERGAWQEAAAGCDLVVHTAAAVTMAGDLAGVYRANVIGTRNVLEAAERGGASRLLHLSTVVTFGFDFPDGVTERDPVQVTGLPYGDTKVAAEQLLLQAHAEGRVPVTIVRPGDVYGPRSRAWALIPVELLRARRLVVPARGVFSPVYVDDLLDGLEAAARGPAGEVFTLSGGVGVANREFFAPYARFTGRPLPLVPGPVAIAGGRVAGRLPGFGEMNAFAARYLDRRGTYSIAKAREVLGWSPKVGVDEGLERTVAWLATL